MSPQPLDLLDEVPGVYKEIAEVMDAQIDLVESLGRFDPKPVKMCPAGERAEADTDSGQFAIAEIGLVVYTRPQWFESRSAGLTT